MRIYFIIFGSTYVTVYVMIRLFVHTCFFSMHVSHLFVHVASMHTCTAMQCTVALQWSVLYCDGRKGPYVIWWNVIEICCTGML